MRTEKQNVSHTADAHLEPSQTSKIESFVEMVSGFESLTIARGKPFKHVTQHVIQHVIYKMLERFAHRLTLAYNSL